MAPTRPRACVRTERPPHAGQGRPRKDGAPTQSHALPLGVSRYTSTGLTRPFRAQLSVSGTIRVLGYYATPEAAHAVAMAARSLRESLKGNWVLMRQKLHEAGFNDVP